ncbi:non-ribosomal peptide synthetase [Nocardiopsis ansamitocini]|uniref:non-ribosomal peptide synthetase n=1 Tax=Nocardiopsis ansamitocini TaxID=1670832 RepID=UPI0025554535|nr:non-ribosomal peptide synthetase [Nocardiopsis ansamitocini]
MPVRWATGSITVAFTPLTTLGDLAEGLPEADGAVVDGVELVTGPALRSATMSRPDVELTAGLVGQAALAPAEQPVATIPFTGPPGVPDENDSSLSHGCLHHMVGEWATRTPEAVAVTSEADGSLTFQELTEQAEGLAQRLRERGVREEEVVGVLAERSPRLVAGLLSVLNAGAAYLALDPESPPERLAALIRQAGVRVVLSDRALISRLAESGADVVPLEPSARAPGAEFVGAPGNLAYVSYTSGSTGVPKAVAVPHSAVTRLVRRPDWADFQRNDVFLQAAPIAFDASTLELWAPLCNGGRLVLFPPGRPDLSRLGATIRDEGVTVLWLTSGLFHRFVVAHLPDLAGVRHLLVGGDVVDPSAAARLLEAYPDIEFTNGYGPTENTTFTTCARIRSVDPDAPLPIGVPIRGSRVLVLDPDLQTVPPGIAGELYAGGSGLARGYLGDPARTANRFVPDPTGRHPGSRLYRTGDMVRARPDGQLDYLGRLDHQVKVNGYRVEPGEVENVLNQNPAVAGCVVVAFPARNGKELVGYLVAEDEGQGDLAGRVRIWLRERLPEHLVPSKLVVIDQVPLTTAGKVDRAALRPPDDSLSRPSPNPYVPPVGFVQRYLCELWAELFEIEQVGVEDDFFELGGHSLTAAEFLDRLQSDRGIQVSARTFYLRPTVLELAELIDSFDASPAGKNGGTP